MKFFAPLVTLVVLLSLSSTEAAFRGAASASNNNNESPSRALETDGNAACAAALKPKKCKKQSSGVSGTKCKWDKESKTCILKEKKACAEFQGKKKKCKKAKHCAWTKGDKTCTDKPEKSCDKYKNEKKCVKKNVDGVPCVWLNGCTAGLL